MSRCFFAFLCGGKGAVLSRVGCVYEVLFRTGLFEMRQSLRIVCLLAISFVQKLTRQV